MSEFIPYGRQLISEDDIEEVVKALKDDFITGGNTVKKFENAFAEKLGAKYAVAVSNGTAALHIAYMAAGLTKNDQFITTPLTFAATANAGLYCGADPVFADIGIHDGNIAPEEIAKRITENTKMIAPVHYAGQPCDMEEIHRLAVKHGLWVIEDACHALGSEYKGTATGACEYSDMCVFSFHPVKHITTGEGGMVTTNSTPVYEKLLLLRNHGIITSPVENWKKDMITLGYNYRLTDFQCALGLNQLSKLDHFIAERQRAAAYYDKLLAEFKYASPVKNTHYTKHAYHLYPVLLNENTERGSFLKHMHKEGIGMQVHYTPVTSHPFYKELGFSSAGLNNAYDFSSKVVSLPLYVGITPEMQDRVAETAFNYLKKE